jgi:hypothetical protein
MARFFGHAANHATPSFSAAYTGAFSIIIIASTIADH